MQSGQALQAADDVAEARAYLDKKGLRHHPDPWKDWDLALFLRRLDRLPRSARILDVGCASSPLLRNLAALGFHDLVGIDLTVEKMEDLLHPDITYLDGDLLKAPFPSATFDAITCLSVIEHGCPERAYLSEMARLLRPGGVLLTSTDYWHRKVSTRKVPRGDTFGLPWRIHTPRSLRRIARMAARRGLQVPGPWDMEVSESPIQWNGRHYTFFAFELAKPESASRPASASP